MAKKRQEEVKQGLPAWMGTYGDMVTLLLCFFVLLFSMSSVDAQKFKEALAPFSDRMDVLPGGAVLTEGDSVNDGVNQMDDIQSVLDKAVLRKIEELNKNNYNSKKKQDMRSPGEMEQLDKALEESKEVYNKVDKYLKDMGAREKVKMDYSLNYVKLTLPGEALFDPGKAEIKKVGYDFIDKMAEVLKKEEFENFSIQIEGHTDNVPINTVRFKSNWELSAARAISVGKHIIENNGINESKVACTGYGEYRPIAPNDTAENRTKNRRVEVKLILRSLEIHADEYGK